MKREITNDGGVRYHIHHKSRLGFLLIVKVVLAFICFTAAAWVFSYVQQDFGLLPAAIVAIAVMFLLYLFILVKVLNLFEFQ